MLSLLLPLTALLLLSVSILGTERLGRPLTDDEKKRFGALLREHDYPGKRLVALRFAYKLTNHTARAQDLMGRADLRLVRFGWDPREIPLVRRLCRLVWSEWTNEASESKTAERAEEAFMRELAVTEGLTLVASKAAELGERADAAQEGEVGVPSHEGQFLARDAAEESRSKGSAKLAKLKAIFEKTGDEVNLLWLKFELEDITDLQQMAQRSGRDVGDFYAAAKRRKTAVRRLLANEDGVPSTQESS